MTRRILTIIVAALVLAVSCNKDKQPKNLDITGYWQLVDYSPATKGVTIGSETVDVHILFEPGGTFTLWQMLGQGRYRTFTGTYTVTGKTLDGKYSDGNAFGSAYELELSGDTLSMTSASGELLTYSREPSFSM